MFLHIFREPYNYVIHYILEVTCPALQLSKWQRVAESGEVKLVLFRLSGARAADLLSLFQVICLLV